MTVQILLDDRIRLVASILAMTDWPAKEQKIHPHGVHPHAKAVYQYLADFADHRAVQGVQALLDNNRTPADIFKFVANLTWPDLDTGPLNPPPAPSKDLRDFLKQSKIEAFWMNDESAWSDAQEQARNAVADHNPTTLLELFFGKIDLTVYFHPNLFYPTELTTAFRRDDEIICIIPPRVAWGTNPPWPYDDDPTSTNQEMFGGIASVLFREYVVENLSEFVKARKQYSLPLPDSVKAEKASWYEQLATIFVSAATVLYLQDSFGDQPSHSFVLMEKRATGFNNLSRIVDLFREYIALHKSGEYGQFVEYLPEFCEALLTLPPE